MAFEHQKTKLDFFLHFGAASLVRWFYRGNGIERIAFKIITV